MGLRLGDQDGYPVGVDNSHPHFHDDPDTCPNCDQEIYGDVCCPFCGEPLEEPDYPDDDGDRAYDLSRDMERGV